MTDSIFWQHIAGVPQPIRSPDFVRDLESRVAWHRHARLLSPLEPVNALAEAARQHGERMRNMRFLAHHDPFDHSDPMKRVRRLDKSLWTIVSENIAAGQWEAAQVMRSWLDSPGHRGDIERPGLDSIGTGVVVGGEHRSYTVQLYAKLGAFVPPLS